MNYLTQSSRAVECNTSEVLISCKKVNIALMYGMPLVVPILSTEHMGNYDVRCLKVYYLLQYTLWLNIYHVLFYCHLRLATSIQNSNFMCFVLVQKLVSHTEKVHENRILMRMFVPKRERQEKIL
jgi:hypothetical protein